LNISPKKEKNETEIGTVERSLSYENNYLTNHNESKKNLKKKRNESMRMNQAVRHLFIKGERGAINDISNQNTVHRDPSQPNSDEKTI
jgi:hypothetical protein